MFRSLSLQVLWAPALVLALAGVTLALQTRALRETQSAPIAQERALLEGSTRLLQTRHARTVRRVRLAILDPKVDNRIAILNDTSEHYLRAMRSLTSESRRRLTGLESVEDRRLAPLEVRLGELFDAIDTEVALVARSVEDLRGAIENDDPDAFDRSLIDFERAEQTVAQRLARLDGITRRLLSVRSERQREPSLRLPSWVFIALGTLAAVALALAAFRVHRVGRGEPASDVEVRIHRAEHKRQARIDELETELSRASRARDVAEQARRRDEQELALMRIYNDNLVNSLRSAVVVTDLDGTINGFNRAARTLLAPRSGESILEHPVGRALTAELPAGQEVLQRAREEPLRTSALRHQDRVFDLAVVPYLDESAAARGYLWLVDDITETVETKNRLLAAERLAAVGRLSAQVAHEIRNPLSAIGLNAELLEEELEAPDPQEARALLRAIAAEIERLTEVTEGYLQLTRIPDPQAQGTNLHDSLRDLLSMLTPELRAHGIDVKLELHAHEALAWVDPAQLRQALLNVIRNAREAMPEGGIITLRIGRENGYAFIEVEDEGPGIPEAVRDRVFEPFFTTKPEGTGLGLSLTRQFVSEQHGEIRLDASPTGGARVRILLPIAEQAHEAPL